MPRMFFGGLTDPQAVHHFSLQVQQVEEGTFKKASGFGDSNEVIEHREVGKDGKQFLSKQPGNFKVEDIVLEHGITASRDLYDWRKKVVEGKMSEARRDGSVVFYDSENREIARYNFTRGWPSAWKGPDVDTTSSEVAMEQITIAHEGGEFV